MSFPSLTHASDQGQRTPIVDSSGHLSDSKTTMLNSLSVDIQKDIDSLFKRLPSFEIETDEVKVIASYLIEKTNEFTRKMNRPDPTATNPGVTAQNLVGDLKETPLQPSKINKDFPENAFLPPNFEQLHPGVVPDENVVFKIQEIIKKEDWALNPKKIEKKLKKYLTAKDSSVSMNSGNAVKSQKKPLNDSSDTAPTPRKPVKIESSTISKNRAEEDYTSLKSIIKDQRKPQKQKNIDRTLALISTILMMKKSDVLLKVLSDCGYQGLIEYAVSKTAHPDTDTGKPDENHTRIQQPFHRKHRHSLRQRNTTEKKPVARSNSVIPCSQTYPQLDYKKSDIHFTLPHIHNQLIPRHSELIPVRIDEKLVGHRRSSGKVLKTFSSDDSKIPADCRDTDNTDTFLQGPLPKPMLQLDSHSSSAVDLPPPQEILNELNDDENSSSSSPTATVIRASRSFQPE